MNKSQGINYQIENDPEAAILVLRLQPNQTIFANDASVTARDFSIEKTKNIDTGNLSGFQEIFQNANLVISEFQAVKFPGSLYLSPSFLGTIQPYSVMANVGIVVQLFSFLACSGEVQLKLLSLPKIQPISQRDSSFFHLMGNGNLWISFNGNCQEILVEDDYVIQLNHLVAFEDSLGYDIKLIEGLSVPGVHSGGIGKSEVFLQFKGKGKLWIQSRDRYALLNYFASSIY